MMNYTMVNPEMDDIDEFYKGYNKQGKINQVTFKHTDGQKITILLNAKSPNPSLFGLAEALTQDLT